MKIGRNAPCPCGSGKKYKKCCMLKNVTAPDELDYRRLSEVYNTLFDRLVEHAERVFGPGGFQVALEEYWLWPEMDEEEQTNERVERQMPLFLPWFLFNWEYDVGVAGVELYGPIEQTVAELYLRDRGPRLTALERRFIEAVNRKPYTFYEVLEVDPGREILLQDVLSGSRIRVSERSGSQHLRPSDIVFGRAVVIDGIGMIVGLSTYVIPPSYKPMIIDLRARMREAGPTISEEDLIEWDFEIRQLYLEVDRILFTRPQMCNTDGDPLELHRVIYEIDSAEAAFEKLVSLCVTRKAAELSKEAERDADGNIRRAEIHWDRKGHEAHGGLSSTILGRIIIDGDRLTAEVNSAKRAKSIRRRIEARLGAGARFKVEEIRSLEGMMRDEALMGRVMANPSEHETLMQAPEVRRLMADTIRAHWEAWVDKDLPALGGRAPREAVQDGDGREAVEALLIDAERRGGDDPTMGEMNREGIRLARALLGLIKSTLGGQTED